MSTHRTWIEINERFLISNVQQLRALLPEGTKFCAVVKANAYGHGLKEVATILARQNVDAFAVDNFDDALTLRALLPSALILTLGYVMPDRFEEAVRERIDLTVYDRETIRALETVAAAAARSIDVHMKVETGLYRQGVLEEQLPDVLETFDQSPHVKLVGLSTHFANLEDAPDTTHATLQLERFQTAEALVRSAGFEPTWIHCACSAGVILYPATHGTMARSGISLYGIWPSEETRLAAVKHVVKCDLTPVLTWKTRIAQVKSVPVATPIGYGLTERTRKASRIAVLPVGYFDGYDRGLSSIGDVLIVGARCKVMGRVAMNMLIVDVSAIPNAAAGMEVVLLGRSGRHNISAEEFATKLGTIPYEILARLNPLLPRLIV